MAKIAIIADTHYGIRGDNQVFYEYFKKFYQKIFFPYLDRNGIKTVVHLGDVVDRRKYINYVTARRLHMDLIQPIFDRNIDFHVIIGNHDVAYKDTNDINSMEELYGSSTKLKIYTRPTEIEIDGVSIALLPWICQDTYDDSIEMLATSKSHILFGHLDLNGFEEYKGHISENRMDSELLQRFDVVLSGHFHHRSSDGNIHYVGATAQHNWSDHDDPRGFAIFDTDTREITYIDNMYEIFHKIVYDDLNKEQNEVLDIDTIELPNTYVKIVVKNKTNPYIFDQFISLIESVGAADVRIVDDVSTFDTADGSEEIDEAEDTFTIVKKYINTLEIPVSKKSVESFFQTLYNEALEING